MSINQLSTIYATWNQLKSYFNQPPAGQTTIGTPGPWRPPAWNNLGVTTPPQIFLIKTGIATTDSSGNIAVAYFFDAIFKVEHTADMTCTSHPIQTGANIVDHLYQNPLRLRMELGMSDSMDSLLVGQWSGTASKSVAAYQTMYSLMVNRTPLIIHTRLMNYQNMIIESINAPDDYKTQFGARFSITFKQIITAQIPTTPPASTTINQNNAQGTLNPTALSQANTVIADAAMTGP